MGFWKNVARGAKNLYHDTVDKIKDFFGMNSYTGRTVDEHVDVDRVLADVRNSMEKEVRSKEKECMESILILFDDLKDKTSERFPDLRDIIIDKQNKAIIELQGTIMNYVREHLSKNDPKFLEILKMSPGSAKKEAVGTFTEKVLDNAEATFNKKLSTYANDILTEFTKRLEGRMNDLNMRLDNQIQKLREIEDQSRKGEMDVEKIKDDSIVVMESAGCILSLMEAER